MKSIIVVTLLGMFGTFCSHNTYRSYSVIDGVMLAVTGEGPDKIHLKLLNDRETPIFLGSSPNYQLNCYEHGRDITETNFGPEYHSGVAFEPLNPGEQIDFTITRPPKKLNCSISIAYFRNVEAVELMARLLVRLSEPTDQFIITDKEEEFLEQSRERIKTSINVDKY